MTLKEKLLGATRVAAEAYNTGMDPSSAVIKAAKDFNFNKDQADRLTEMFNTALTLHQFEKNASDRTGEFPLADKNVVTNGLYKEEKVEKKASYDYSFYTDTPRNFVKEASTRPMEKAAEYIAPEELTPEYIAHQGLRYVTLAKQAAEEAKSTEYQIRAKMITELYKLAESIKQGYDPENRYRKIKTAAKKYPKILENLERVLPERFTKLSASDEDDEDIVDFSDIADEEEMFKKLQGMMDHVNEFHMTSVSFSKKAEDMWKKVTDGYFEKRSFFDKLLDGARKENTTASIMDFAGGLSHVTPKKEDIPEYDAELKKKRTSESNKQRVTGENMEREAILTELLLTDPIIRDADPDAVAQAYETLVNMTPEASLYPELVRSVLRNAVNSMALDAVTAKSYVDLDRGLRGINQVKIV